MSGLNLGYGSNHTPAEWNEDWDRVNDLQNRLNLHNSPERDEETEKANAENNLQNIRSKIELGGLTLELEREYIQALRIVRNHPEPPAPPPVHPPHSDELEVHEVQRRMREAERYIIPPRVS
jgi:hypothetical protein